MRQACRKVFRKRTYTKAWADYNEKRDEQVENLLKLINFRSDKKKEELRKQYQVLMIDNL